jgi:cation-transporting ATPase 13A1
MNGVKAGDAQMTAVGLLVTAMFFFVSRAKPLKALAPTRPPSSVLCLQAGVSILLQFGIHLICIVIATRVSLPFLDPDDPSITPDGTFNPNVINSCTFIVSTTTMLSTFAANYRGPPYMQGIRENKAMFYGLIVSLGGVVLCATELFEPLNYLLQLSLLPEEGTTVFISLSLSLD